MPSSSAVRSGAHHDDLVLGLVWGAWTELGLSGWARTHARWAVDVEPLLVFTAALGDRDPRLRDEVTDWCALNWQLISKARLKNLLSAQPDAAGAAFGELAATVADHAPVTWPGATLARPFTRTSRSTVPDLTRGSAVWLRVRAMFGVGARAEILRALLSLPPEPHSIAQIAATAGFTKRNVADECEILERAGVLTRRLQSNRFVFSLARQAELEAFIGEMPLATPDWTAMLHVAQQFSALRTRESSQATRVVHAKQTLNAVSDDLAVLGLAGPPAGLRGSGLWEWTQDFTERTVACWSQGDWPAGQR